MAICPSCQQTSDVFWDSNLEKSVCPVCKQEIPTTPSDRQVSVARVTNLAEAGFLANDLMVHGIDARIFAAESFSALAGRWTSDYFIQVASTEGQAAAAVIRSHLADDSGEDPWDESAHRFLAEEERDDLVYWRPVALLVLAGVASFVLGQRFAEEQLPRPQPVPRDSLPAAVHAIGRQFVTEPVGGRPGHRLWYQPRHRCWYLETDSDGDGQYERRERFHPSGMRW